MGLRQGDLVSTGYRDGQFDVVLCTEVLEHDKNPHLILKEIFRILKNDGAAFFSFPRHNKREAHSHINYFIDDTDSTFGADIPEEFNVIRVDEMLYNSPFDSYRWETIVNDKFYIVWAYK
jgi:SAM-dependent methyltransferase